MPDDLLRRFGYEAYPLPGDGPEHEAREEGDEPPVPGDVALCLSGGGIRAAAFHLGAVRRLAEAGALARVGIVSAVSGGSIFAAFLLEHLAAWPVGPTTAIADEVEPAFVAFAAKNQRRGLVGGRLIGRPFVETMVRHYERELSGRPLSELPTHPRYVFNATDLGFGVNWMFERERVGSYRAGYLDPATSEWWTVGRAVAASSCFPPVFRPMRLSFTEDELSGARQRSARYEELIGRVRLSDGGVYDNLGLQPALSARVPVVLSSDGGMPFARRSPTGMLGEVLRYASVFQGQVGSLRRAGLFGSYGRDTFGGTYWGIGSAPERYEKAGEAGPFEGYSKALAGETIGRVRTDLDAFSEAEVGVLVNHGYTLVEAALRRDEAGLIRDDAVPFEWPYPALRDEATVREALAQSGRRRLFGRWAAR